MQISRKTITTSKEIVALILDLDSTSGFGETIQEVLADSVSPRVQVCLASLTDCDPVAACEEVHKKLPGVRPDIIFLSTSANSLALCPHIVRTLSETFADPPIMAIIDEGTAHDIIDILKLGVADFMIPPLNSSDLLSRVWRLLEQKQECGTPLHTLKKTMGLKQMIGESRAFLAELEKIPVVARCDSSVLISGETGTGKELCARAIHYLSPRSGKPFLPVNCGAIPAELVENELFGHVRGAFTGASGGHEGLVRETNEGTLFLDEVDCLPLSAQAKLLRFVQEKEYRQLGSAKVRQANVRIIAATNADLGQAVKEGKFRQDLFYRLSIVEVALPPLRQRKQDIPALARHFLRENAAEMNKQVRDFSPEALRLLMNYDWPGNVRELENVMKRTIIFSKNDLIRAEEIVLPKMFAMAARESFRAEKAKVVADFEKRYMQELLETHGGNISKAAKAAQKNRRAFWELMRKYDINVETYKSPFS